MTDEQLNGMFEALNRRINDLYQRIAEPIVRNDKGMTENSEAVLDIADLSDENSSSIEELAEMVADLEERVSVLENG